MIISACVSLVERQLSLFYKVFLIDAVNRKATQLCPWVTTGVMHRDFVPYLRENGLGIDYSEIEERYDTRTVLEKKLGMKYPEWERRLRNAMELKDRHELEAALANVAKFHLETRNNDLVLQANVALTQL
jgi:hypothetical protein